MKLGDLQIGIRLFSTQWSKIFLFLSSHYIESNITSILLLSPLLSKQKRRVTLPSPLFLSLPLQPTISFSFLHLYRNTGIWNPAISSIVINVSTASQLQVTSFLTSHSWLFFNLHDRLQFTIWPVTTIEALLWSPLKGGYRLLKVPRTICLFFSTIVCNYNLQLTIVYII